MGTKLITLKCTTCQKYFDREYKQYKYQKRISGENYKVYCSQICQGAQKFNKKEVACANCGKLHFKSKSDINKGFDNFFCSHSCRATFNNIKRKKDGYTLKDKTKQVNCSLCFKECEISIFASAAKAICAECYNSLPPKLWSYDRKKRDKKYLYDKECSLCKEIFKIHYGKYCKKCLPIVQQAAGKNAAAKRQDIKRSKNEILFSELCEKNFINVTNNQPMFNGWDSDVQLHDYKIAVHWNGPWHYKYCGGKHSVEQVQARDKIKHNNIIKCGWTNYIIIDMGKYNKELVEQEFEKFKNFVKANHERISL